MAIPPLVLRIYADSTGVKAGVAQAQGQVASLRASVARNAALIKTAFIGAVVVGLHASVKAAIEAQEAQLKLANSIQNSAVVSSSAVSAFNDQANAIRDLTGVDDEAITGLQSLLVQFGLTADQVKELSPLVADLSVKFGTDLTTAGKAVGRAVDGTTGGLSRLGVRVDKNLAATDAYAATLKALGGAAGFAAQKANAQPWVKLGAQFEEIAESVGEALLPVMKALTPVLKTAADAIGNLARPIATSRISPSKLRTRRNSSSGCSPSSARKGSTGVGRSSRG